MPARLTAWSAGTAAGAVVRRTAEPGRDRAPGPSPETRHTAAPPARASPTLKTATLMAALETAWSAGSAAGALATRTAGPGRERAPGPSPQTRQTAAPPAR